MVVVQPPKHNEIKVGRISIDTSYFWQVFPWALSQNEDDIYPIYNVFFYHKLKKSYPYISPIWRC